MAGSRGTSSPRSILCLRHVVVAGSLGGWLSTRRHPDSGSVSCAHPPACRAELPRTGHVVSLLLLGVLVGVLPLPLVAVDDYLTGAGGVNAGGLVGVGHRGGHGGGGGGHRVGAGLGGVFFQFLRGRLARWLGLVMLGLVLVLAGAALLPGHHLP